MFKFLHRSPLIIHFIEVEIVRLQLGKGAIFLYRSLIRHLIKFGKIKRINDCTYANIQAFDIYLHTPIPSSTSRYKIHTALRRFLRIAQNRGLCTYNPYIDFRVVRGKSREAIYLVNSEIECIRTFETQDPKLAFSRDCFLFQIFTGLAFCDIKKFSRSDVQDLNDYKIIRGTRKKTGQVFVSLFLPEAQAIAEKYEYQFFLPTNITYNKYIKRLAAHCGINKPITSHSARHTYATYLLNKGVRIETVSRAMGHGDIQMTQSYAKLLANTIVEEMAQKLVQHIK